MRKTVEVYSSLNMPIAESYNALRENIKFYKKKDIKVISVTSSKPKEGKTTVAINLAISLAKTKAKVLLIDADLRKQTVVKHLGKENTLGVVDFVMDNCFIENITFKTSIDNLDYISGGKTCPNASELISSMKFRELIFTAKWKYDFIIIDTPALGGVIDGYAISAMADGTILVVETGEAEIEAVKGAKAGLINANAEILGVVLNKVNRREYKRYFKCYNYFFSDGKFKQSDKMSENIEGIYEKYYNVRT